MNLRLFRPLTSAATHCGAPGFLANDVLAVTYAIACVFAFASMFCPAGASAAGRELKAFPSAEGMGKDASGGRGGQVIKVTNLNDSGRGSLRAAVEASGARTVVFDVAGTIWLDGPLVVREPDITIAGQTAPGEGICLAGDELMVRADNVIVRYLRVRPGDVAGRDVDAISVVDGNRVIIDHCSASWAVDETLSVSSHPNNVTVQWCLIAEGLHNSVHSSGDPHSKGSLVNGEFGARYSFHHNLFAHQSDRCPQVGNRTKSGDDPDGLLFDFRNNVIYNWGSDADGWESAGQNRNSDSVSRYNFVGNAYVPGPTTVPAFKFYDEPPHIRYEYWAFEELCPRSKAHFSGNTMDGVPWADDWKHVSIEADVLPDYQQTRPFAFPGHEIPSEDASEAYARVVGSAGASLRRDAVDTRVIENVVRGTGRLINSQSDVGGWPLLASAPAPPDRDGDGMPDAWEEMRGLAPRDPRDAARDRDGDGYTNIEEYIHGLVDEGFDFDVVVATAGDGSVSLSGDGGRVPRGGGVTAEITPAPHWRLAEATVDGTDVTSDVSGGVLVLDGIEVDVALHVVFEPNMTTEKPTPHWWLAQHGAVEDFELAAVGDDDRDGLAAWQEFRIGTDPADPSSAHGTGLVVVGEGAAKTVVFRYRRPAHGELVSVYVETSSDGTQWERVPSGGLITLEDQEETSFGSVVVQHLPAGAPRAFIRATYVFE